MRYSWDHSVSLPWIEVFVVTIEVLVAAAKSNWEAFLGPESEKSSPFFQSRLGFGSFRHALQIKHIVSALYNIGLTMAATVSRDELYAGIVLGSRPIGWIRYELNKPRSEGSSYNSTFLADGNYTLNNMSPNLPGRSPISSHVSTNNSYSPRSATIKDEKFVIKFELQGVQMEPAHMFELFVDAIAITAQHDHDESRASIRVSSRDRRVSMIVRRDKTSGSLKWGDALHALEIIWRFVVVGNKSPTGEPTWEDMIFEIYEDGKRVGEGFIVSHERPIPPSDTAVAK